MASIETEALRKEGFFEDLSNVLLIAQFRQSVSGTCSSTEKTSHNILFQKLGYDLLLSRNSPSSSVQLKTKRGEGQKGKKKLQKKMVGGEEVECHHKG